MIDKNMKYHENHENHEMLFVSSISSIYLASFKSSSSSEIISSNILYNGMLCNDIVYHLSSYTI